MSAPQPAGQTRPNQVILHLRLKQGENENYEIAQYNAKSLKLLGAKIAHFPKGSQFIMTSGSPKSEEQKKLDGIVKSLLEQHGMVAERETAEPMSP